MAKYRHRIFEMYEHRDEAIEALTPKSARLQAKAAEPEEWVFRQLNVSLTDIVTHVQFKETQLEGAEIESELRDDFAKLAKSLVADSKVLLDFTGVESFSPNSIEPLVTLNQRLRTKGSWIVLCCLAPPIRELFFAPAERRR